MKTYEEWAAAWANGELGPDGYERGAAGSAWDAGRKLGRAEGLEEAARLSNDKAVSWLDSSRLPTAKVHVLRQMAQGANLVAHDIRALIVTEPAERTEEP